MFLFHKNVSDISKKSKIEMFLRFSKNFSKFIWYFVIYCFYQKIYPRKQNITMNKNITLAIKVLNTTLPVQFWR